MASKSQGMKDSNCTSEEKPSENQTDFKNSLQKDDVHIKIIDTDARFRRGPNQRWWPPNRNKNRYWRPPQRGRNWNRKRWTKWKQRLTTPMPTSTVLVEKETGNRRVVITRPDRKRQPNKNQTRGGSTSISRRKGHQYWNVPPFVLKMKKKLKQKIRQMSNMIYNGLTDTLYNITRRSKYIIKTYADLKEDSRQLISDTHDIINAIVESSNNIYDTVLSISAFDRRLFERLYEQGRSPTPSPIPDVTDLVNVNYNLVNREAFISLRTLKHMRNKFFQMNHTYARHMVYYYDRLDRISEIISGQRFRIGDMMDMAMYVNNQMSNMTKLKVPRVLRQIRDETQELITDNYKNRHRLYIAEQIHEDVTTFQKSCHLRLEELSKVNYTLLKQLPRPTIEPLNFKEKRKLQILVNRVKGHEENILRSAAEIDKHLPTLINSGKSLILELSAEAQSDSYKVWALEKMMKRWYKMSSGAYAATNGRYSKRKWMRMRRKRIRRMRKRMPKFKYPVSKRRRRAVDTLQEDVEKIYDAIIHKLTDIIKKLDAMWLKLFKRKDGKCDQIGVEGSGNDDTEVECELQGSGKMDITESESGTIPSFSLAGKNDNDDSNGDFEFTDVKTIVVSSHWENLQAIIHTSLSQSKSQQKMSKNLGRDVKDIKVSLDEIRANKRILEIDVNKSAEVVSIYDGLVRNASEMRRLLNETEQKIKATQVKCKVAQKVADLVLGDKNELERLLEKRIKEKEREKQKEDGDAEKKKKRKRLKDKSDNNVDKRRKDGNKGGENGGKEEREEESVERAEVSRKLLEENEETKAELKELIEKYLRLQKIDEKRKNEDKEKKKKKKKTTDNDKDSKKRRRNRSKKHSNKNERIKKNEHRKNDFDSTRRQKKRKNEENGDKQMKTRTDEENKRKEQGKNDESKSRKDKLKLKKGEESVVKKRNKKKMIDNRKNGENVDKLTEKKDAKIDIGSVLEIKKNLEDVLKKLNQRFDESKKMRHRRRRKGKRIKRLELESKKMNVRPNVNSLVGKKMVSDEKENKELNEKEKDLNKNERKRKKKTTKNDVKDLKENMNEDDINNELKKKHKKDRNRRKSKNTIQGELEENVRTNITKNKKQKKDVKKTKRKHTMEDFVLNGKETVNNKKNKELNEKEKDKNENEEKKKKRRKKAKNETKVKESKENVIETKKKHKKNRNEKQTNKTIEGNLEDTRKKERKTDVMKKERKTDVKKKERKTDVMKKERKTDVMKKERKTDVKKKERKTDVKKKERKTDLKKIMAKNKNKEMNEEKKDQNETKETRNQKKAKNEVKDSEKNEDEIKKKHKKDRNRKKTNEKVEVDLKEDTSKRRTNEKRKKEKKKKNDETDGFVSNEKETVNDKKNKELNEKEKDENETTKKRKRKRKDRKVDLDKKKKERKQEKKSDNISAILRMALLDERALKRNNSRNRKTHRKRKKTLSEQIQSPPIFIQNEEQNFAEEMKNQSQQIEADVYKSKAAVESIVKQLKEFSPDPCTFMSKNIKQLRLNVSHIRQQIQLARTIVASMKIPVSMDGEDHLEVMLDRNAASREIQSSAEICIKPKTRDAIILLLQANNSISYSLSLVESKPLLTIWDSDGEVLQKLEADMELIQDNWYQLLIHRIGQNFSLSVNPTDLESKGITVEKFIPDFSPEQIPLSLVSLGGGHPQDFPISNSEKLKGCIAYLNVNGHSTHIFSPYKTGLYPSICKSGCESLVNTSMVFEGNGFALFELDEETISSVRLTFKTFQDTALIMAIKTKSEMFLLVKLMEGNIQIESQVKSSRIFKQSKGIQFSDGQPHTIKLIEINNDLEIEISDEDVAFEEKDASNDDMLFDEGISLGGLFSNLPNEFKYRSYTGCLSNLNIDGKPFNLLSLKDGRHVYEGNCEENTWVSCVRFTKSSIPVSLTKYDFVKSVSLMVSSQAQGVALFFQRDSKFSIKLELTTTTLEVYNYKDEEKRIVPKNNGSGFWHLLHIEDQEGNIHITVDGEQSIDVSYEKNTAGWFSPSNAEDFSMSLTIGGLPDSLKNVETFLGSISTLIIQHSFINLNKEFTNSNKLLTCAKPTVELFTNKLECTELSK